MDPFPDLGTNRALETRRAGCEDGNVHVYDRTCEQRDLQSCCTFEAEICEISRIGTAMDILICSSNMWTNPSSWGFEGSDVAEVVIEILADTRDTKSLT